MKFFVHPPAWLRAAQLPLQAVVLAYIGAGGLAGAAIVGGVMLSPVGEVVQEAVAPARQFVESVVPMSFPSDPGQPVARVPVGKPQGSTAASPTTAATPVAVDEVPADEVVAESTPTPQSPVIAPQRSVPTAQNTLPPAPVATPEIGLPVQSGPAAVRPAIAQPPLGAVEPVAPAVVARPAAVTEPVRSGARPKVTPDAQAGAASEPPAPRIVSGNANVDVLRVATVASPTTIVVRSAGNGASEPPPTATAVPTVIPPTRAPTQVPTSAPTDQPRNTATPTAKPTQTPVPTSVPTRVPPGTVRATPEPTRATPVREKERAKEKEKEREKEKEKEKRPTPVPTPSRRDHDDRGGHRGDDQNSKHHDGG